GAELPAIPDQIVVLTQCCARIRLDLALVTRHGRGERVMEKRPVAGLFVALEEGEVDHPVEDFLAGLGEAELTTEVRAQAAEDARNKRLIAGCEEHRCSRRGSERGQLAGGEELRDRRAC